MGTDKTAYRAERSPKNTKTTRQFSSRFVPGDLGPTEKAECKVWTVWDERGDDMVSKLLAEGFRLTLKLDDRSGGFMVFVNAPEQPHPFAGWVLSGRGSTAFKALKQACYRHFALFDGDWPIQDQPSGPDDFDD